MRQTSCRAPAAAADLQHGFTRLHSRPLDRQGGDLRHYSVDAFLLRHPTCTARAVPVGHLILMQRVCLGHHFLSNSSGPLASTKATPVGVAQEG